MIIVYLLFRAALGHIGWVATSDVVDSETGQLLVQLVEPGISAIVRCVVEGLVLLALFAFSAVRGRAPAVVCGDER